MRTGRILANVSIRYFFGLFLFLIGWLSAPGANPRWWEERGVLKMDASSGFPIDPDDFAVVSQGALKNIAEQAFAEFSAKLSPFGGLGDMTPPNASLPRGGTGWRLTNAIGSLTNSENFRTAKVGQAKALAEPFYDRLIELDALVQYPWVGATRPPDDFALVNAGSVKALFSFTVDEDEDGMLDEWERRMFGSLLEDADGDFDRDGVTNIAERNAGTPPNDFYNGASQQIETVSGANQVVLPNRILPAKIRVRLRKADHQLLPNAPLTFEIGGGLLSRTGAEWAAALTSTTDDSGIAEVYVGAPSLEGAHSVTVRAGISTHFVLLTVNYDLPPLAPTDVQVQPATDHLLITWVDRSADEQSFQIERSRDQQHWRIIATVPANTTEYTDFVSAGVQYFYRVTSSYDAP